MMRPILAIILIVVVISCLIGEVFVHLNSSATNKWWINFIIATIIFAILAAFEIFGPGLQFS